MQVPGVRAGLASGKEWHGIAQQQIRQHFGTECKAAAAQRLAEMLENLDFLCELQAPTGSKTSADTSSASMPPKPVKVSCYRKATDKVRRIRQSL
jgi:ribosomal protein L37AE/L43A